ncbi:MAG: hypothetical protein HGB21_10620 [Nitrospirae bacterium]|nr:hypothetical protein [Nitrospirota bacterium]NTW66740.1 hypothetical protein [Nitrospirota bacterium]
MFAGHLGAALAIGRAEQRINIGAFVFASLLIDFALWLFVLLGWESVTIPADYASTHQPEFVFSYSHSLLAIIAWSASAGIVTFLWYPHLKGPKLRAAAFVALAVFSHWLLDDLVHVAGLPLAGAGSSKVGLGLWRNMPVALAVEGLILVIGLGLFLSHSGLPLARKFWLSVLSLVTLVFTVVGMTIAPPPPSVTAMAASSLVTVLLVSSLAG